MTVNIADVPAEGLPFFGYRLKTADIVGTTEPLEFIAVHDCRHIIQPLPRREQGAFPDSALLRLAIADNNIYPTLAPLLFESVRHAEANAEAMAKRTAR